MMNDVECVNKAQDEPTQLASTLISSLCQNACARCQVSLRPHLTPAKHLRNASIWHAGLHILLHVPAVVSSTLYIQNTMLYWLRCLCRRRRASLPQHQQPPRRPPSPRLLFSTLPNLPDLNHQASSDAVRSDTSRQVVRQVSAHPVSDCTGRVAGQAVSRGIPLS